VGIGSGYLIGNTMSGWSGFPWDVVLTTGSTASLTITNQVLNCGVPLPMDIYPGSEIRICGVAFNQSANDGDPFEWGVYYWPCSMSSSFTASVVSFGSGVFDRHKICFSTSTVIPEKYQRCSYMAVVFSDRIGAGDLKFSYTLNVRTLSSGVSDT